MTRALLLALLVGGCAAPAPGPAPFPEAAAAKTAPELVALYETFRAGDDPAAAAAPGLQVADGSVRIEATASAPPAADLAAALGRLGLTDADAVGVVVNGSLPVASLAAAAALPELRALRPVLRPDRTPPRPPERL